MGAGVKRCAHKKVDIEEGVAIAVGDIPDVYAFVCIFDVTRRSISISFIVSTFNTRVKGHFVGSYSSTVTATETIFNFRHVWAMRQAISPRLAIKTFWITGRPSSRRGMGATNKGLLVGDALLIPSMLIPGFCLARGSGDVLEMFSE